MFNFKGHIHVSSAFLYRPLFGFKLIGQSLYFSPLANDYYFTRHRRNCTLLLSLPSISSFASAVIKRERGERGGVWGQRINLLQFFNNAAAIRRRAKLVGHDYQRNNRTVGNRLECNIAKCNIELSIIML